jgi:carboxypeptidase family protein
MMTTTMRTTTRSKSRASLLRGGAGPGPLRGESPKNFGERERGARIGARIFSARAANISRAGFVVTLLAICAATGARVTAAQGNKPPMMLVHATVFSDQGFSVKYARVRMRRDSESKWRWEAATDDEGEFALYAPQGAQYVLRIDAKGFQPLTENIDGTAGDDVELTLRLIPLAGGK